jgi:hypothetical protein
MAGKIIGISILVCSIIGLSAMCGYTLKEDRLDSKFPQRIVEQNRNRVNNFTCTWSDKYNACFCEYGDGTDYAYSFTWVPPAVCGK